MADETVIEGASAVPDELDYINDAGAETPSEPAAEPVKPNGDAKPEAPAQEAPGLDSGKLLEKLGIKVPAKETAPAPEADRIAALEAKIAELTAAQKPAQAPPGGDMNAVRQAMIQAAMAKDPSIDAESAGADADVLLTMFQAAMPQLQPQTSLSDADRALLDNVLQFAQRASWTTAEETLGKEFGDEWPALKGTLQQLHAAMGEPEWMESVPMLTILGHGLRAMSGQTAAQAAAAGKRDAVRQGRRQAETTRGADVGSGKEKTDELDWLRDPTLMRRQW